MPESRTADPPRRAYRIGHLNPRDVSAENQCFVSQQVAASRLGHVVIQHGESPLEDPARVRRITVGRKSS